MMAKKTEKKQKKNSKFKNFNQSPFAEIPPILTSTP